MSNNDHNNSSCSRAEQLVSYLYGEADAREKSEFETHLKNCSACADELAAFGFVRSAVLDWRAEEFSRLPTPAFDVPFAESKESFSETAASNGNRSRFAEFRQLFSFNRLKLAAAFGVLIVCVGVAWLAFDFSGGDQMTAENGDDKKPIRAAASPTVEIVKKPEENRAAVKSDENRSPVAADSPPIKRGKSDSPNKPVVRATGNAPKNNSDGFARKLKDANEGVKKTSPVQRKQIPNLNDAAADDEDETIRLADLFDELDAK